MSRDQWHKRRAQGVGGSDVASIFGVSPWNTPQDCYKRKVGVTKPDKSNPKQQRGHDWESYIVDKSAEILGRQINRGVEFCKHPRWSEGYRLQANTDGTILPRWPGEGRGLLEAKTTGMFTSTARDVRAGVVPFYYSCQVQHYLACTGMSWGVLATLMGPHEDEWTNKNTELALLDFKRNTGVIAVIEDVCREFWEHVEAVEMPPWERHPMADTLEECLRTGG